MATYRDPETAKRPADPAERQRVLDALEEFKAQGPDALIGAANMEADYRKEFGLGDEPLAEVITTEQRLIYLRGAVAILPVLLENYRRAQARH
jgi:phage tail tape-measure protein